jgi:hypothetical protein
VVGAKISTPRNGAAFSSLRSYPKRRSGIVKPAKDSASKLVCFVVVDGGYRPHKKRMAWWPNLHQLRINASYNLVGV